VNSGEFDELQKFTLSEADWDALGTALKILNVRLDNSNF